MLLGLLAALLPLAVHLFGRKKAPVVTFSALAFILASNPKQARALQVSEWLLVLLRSAAVALVAIALAKPMLPVWGAQDAVLQGAQGPTAVVVILDDSMSMQASDGKMMLFERARARAIALIERLPQGSIIAAVTAGYPARMLIRQLTSDRSAVIDAVRKIELHPRRDDASRALALAEALLVHAELSERRVVLWTDLQATGWKGISPPWSTKAQADGSPIELRVDVLRPNNIENTAITDAVATSASDRGPNQVRVEVALQNFGQKPFRGYLTLRAGDRETKSLLNLAPAEALRRGYVLQAAAPIAEIALPDDALNVDNRRLARLDGGAAVRVALINGAPRPVPREDEVFFAANALEMSTLHPGEMTVDVLQLPGLTSSALKDYDVLMLANVGELPAELLRGLVDAASQGKGILITVGDNLPADLTTYLPGLLPAKIFGVRQPSGSDPAKGKRRSDVAVRVQPPDAAGQTTAAAQRLRVQLEADLGDLLQSCAVQKYALVEPAPELSSQTVLQFSDGAPAFIVTPRGRGLIGLWTTTLDLDWTDLPLQPVFLPLIHDAIVALAGDRGLERRSAVEIGEVAVLSRDERADQLEVKLQTPTTPNAGVPRRTLNPPQQRGLAWQINGLEEPGRYTATELKQGVALTSRAVIAVPPASESNLVALTTGPLLQTSRTVAGNRQTAKAPGWSAVLFVLMGLLTFEGVVLLRGAAPRVT